MSLERESFEALRDETITFLSSRIYQAFLSSTQEDLSTVEERILNDEIESDKDTFSLLNLRGQRTVLKSNLTIFEDAVTTLGNRIEQMILDEEQQNVTQPTNEE